MAILSKTASDRLADAALLLLDAARETAKESPSYKPGTLNSKEVLALATQAILTADNWNHAGGDKVKLPEGYTDRWVGVAIGLGANVGLLDNAKTRLIALLAISASLQHGAEIGMQSRGSF